MQICGLIRLKLKTNALIASINCIQNGLGYTRSDFFIEFNLDMEVSHLYQDKKKVSFVCIGTFKEDLEMYLTRVPAWNKSCSESINKRCGL
jgi:hypothetical protein